MPTIEEIRLKYGLNDGSVSFAVDIEGLRQSANEALADAEDAVKEFSRRPGTEYNKDWAARRKSRITARIKEQKRSVDMALKFLGEVSDVLNKASETIKKV